eukprot:gene11116-biopygen18367
MTGIAGNPGERGCKVGAWIILCAPAEMYSCGGKPFRVNRSMHWFNSGWTMALGPDFRFGQSHNPRGGGPVGAAPPRDPLAIAHQRFIPSEAAEWWRRRKDPKAILPNTTGHFF